MSASAPSWVTTHSGGKYPIRRKAIQMEQTVPSQAQEKPYRKCTHNGRGSRASIAYFQIAQYRHSALVRNQCLQKGIVKTTL